MRIAPFRNSEQVEGLERKQLPRNMENANMDVFENGELDLQKVLRICCSNGMFFRNN